MRAEVVIEEALMSNFRELLHLYTEFYNELRSKQGLRAYGVDELRSEVSEILARNKVFIARLRSGEPVGFIRVSNREGCYWIEEVYVRPEYRRQGIGRSLVKAAEEYIAKNDSYVYIMVLPQDRDAMRFWLHMGYTLLNTVELSKNLKSPEDSGDTRPLPFLSDLLKIYRWAREEYDPLEIEFLKLVEEFVMKGYGGRDLLKVFVKALKQALAEGND